MTLCSIQSIPASFMVINTWLWEVRYGFRDQSYLFFKTAFLRISRMISSSFLVIKIKHGSSLKISMLSGNGMMVHSNTRASITRTSWLIFGISLVNKFATSTIKMVKEASSSKSGLRRMTRWSTKQQPVSIRSILLSMPQVQWVVTFRRLVIVSSRWQTRISRRSLKFWLTEITVTLFWLSNIHLI